VLEDQYRLFQAALEALRQRLTEVELRDFEVGGVDASDIDRGRTADAAPGTAAQKNPPRLVVAE